MSERINWVNFASKDSQKKSTQPNVMCEANVALHKINEDEFGSRVTAVFSCQRCEIKKGTYVVTSANLYPESEISEVMEETAKFLKVNCNKLAEEFKPYEITSKMLPPILRNS
jgi:hypothetical protein